MVEIENCTEYNSSGDCKACADLYKLSSNKCKTNVVLVIIIILSCLLFVTIVVVSVILYIKKKKQRIADSVDKQLFKKNDNELADSVLKETVANVTIQNEKTVNNFKDNKDNQLQKENKNQKNPGLNQSPKKLGKTNQIINAKKSGNNVVIQSKNKLMKSLVPPERSDAWVLRKMQPDVVPGINTNVCKNVGCQNYPDKYFDSLNSEPSDIRFQEFKDVCHTAIMLKLDNQKTENEVFSTNPTGTFSGQNRGHNLSSPQRTWDLNQTVDDSVNVGQNNTIMNMTMDHNDSFQAGIQGDNDSFNEKNNKVINFQNQKLYNENNIPLDVEKGLKDCNDQDKTQEICDPNLQNSDRSKVNNDKKYTQIESDRYSNHHQSPDDKLHGLAFLEEKQSIPENSDSKMNLELDSNTKSVGMPNLGMKFSSISNAEQFIKVGNCEDTPESKKKNIEDIKEKSESPKNNTAEK